ncbi:hypothetical protein D047_4574B, partial [Vibrio parahaemolyticus VPTS-2010_2]
DFGVEP